ncbi:Putative phosphoserine phosphatase 2 [Paenibacillus konkukensis]|uniref:Phosphoserine phosphatase 2 n=1 Tax=Paenibacillus konkukensis TaxID=2020716 RepID=A0ABY4RZB8_9BACL|nr:histidine phosphatase family protein [Paenibacillus konkukensis]UQZ86833.1 Putative phosphoserine phosphatase 2 [Paenibacillus konkukensis]
MTRVGLIRHGVTYWNKEGRTQGHSHNELDEEGIAQAHLLAERLSGEDWTVIVSSDLRRARQTAEIISGRLGIAIAGLDERLRELGRGQVEGYTEEERVERWGAGWRQMNLGLESGAAGGERGSCCIRELARKYAGEKILVVSHGAVLRHSLNRLISGLPTGDPLNNTSLTILKQAEGDQWECELYNCTRHLKAW